MAEEFTTPKWYVVHTYSGYENKVASTITKMVENSPELGKRILEIVVPTEKVTEIKDGKQKEIIRKKLPGYVLIHMHYDNKTWYDVRNTRGVTGFVGPGGDGVPLTEKELAALISEEDTTTTTVEVDFKIDDEVTVIGTALDGFTGIVKGINTEEGTAEVLVDMFGQETPATVKLTQIVKSE
ncbi:MAG: transcription termination/antitermination protein NusG [Ruminococcus sp.]|jgi:transcriptional antiterminator NusG|nr:transcription termination/antitermination protein NusG [Ruminococcus sp.]